MALGFHPAKLLVESDTRKEMTPPLSGLWPGLTVRQGFLEDQKVEEGELDEEEEIGGC